MNEYSLAKVQLIIVQIRFYMNRMSPPFPMNRIRFPPRHP